MSLSIKRILGLKRLKTLGFKGDTCKDYPLLPRGIFCDIKEVVIFHLYGKIPKTSSGSETPFKQCRLSVNHTLWSNLFHSWEYLTKKPNENLQLALHVSISEIMGLFTQNRLPRGKDLRQISICLWLFRELLQRDFSEVTQATLQCNLIAFLFPSNSKLNFRVRPNSNTS